MQFGVREICEVTLRAKATQYLGSRKFYKNEPIIKFDTLKTSSLEGAATTVYATGGRGNTRLVAWEGERTLTFTMEDALISPESFSILSGAGLIDATKTKPIYVHTQSQVPVEEDNIIVLPVEACWNGYDKEHDLYHNAADIFVMVLNNGQIATEPCIPMAVDSDCMTLHCYGHSGKIEKGSIVLVDYYVKKTGGAQVIEIKADQFGGNYYLEASTLFRDQQSGVDMPAEFIIPNCKVQSNFTFTMAATGDPSTFTFTMDAFPDYTKFDQTHKVLASLQVITEAVDDVDEKRAPCLPVTNEHEDVMLDYKYSIDKKTLDITATGENVKSMTKEEQTEVGFGGLPASMKMVTVDIDLPVNIGESYRLKTISPLHKHYPSDPCIKEDDEGNKYKEQFLTEATSSKWTITTAIPNEEGTIKFELYKLADKIDKEGTLITTINVDNQVKFA